VDVDEAPPALRVGATENERPYFAAIIQLPKGKQVVNKSRHIRAIITNEQDTDAELCTVPLPSVVPREYYTGTVEDIPHRITLFLYW